MTPPARTRCRPAAPGVARPHAVTADDHRRSRAQAAVSTNYTYDATGNTLCRPAGTAANDCCPTATGSQLLELGRRGRAGHGQGRRRHDAADQHLRRRRGAADPPRHHRHDALPARSGDPPGRHAVNTGTRYYSFAGGLIASPQGSSAPADLTWLLHRPPGHPADRGQRGHAGRDGPAADAVSAHRAAPSPAWANRQGLRRRRQRPDRPGPHRRPRVRPGDSAGSSRSTH